MDPRTADKLHELLTRLYGAHEELLAALHQQQQAIRRFDADGLEKLRDRCDAVAQRIAELEEARARLTGPGVRLSALVPTLGEPQRSRLAAISAGLRKLAEEVASVGRVNAVAVHNMLNHFHTVYRLMAGARSPAGYTAAGGAAAGGGALLIDAVA